MPSKHIFLPTPNIAFFLSAFAALGDPASRARCDKKITQGKHHTQTLQPQERWN